MSAEPKERLTDELLAQLMASASPEAYLAESGIADIYPNPVSTVLYVRTGAFPVPATAKLFSTSGKLLLEKTLSCDAFSPMTLDMTSCAPGRYRLKVTYGSLSDTFTVVKL